MTNVYYNHDDGAPTTASPGRSITIRNEYDLIEDGFDAIVANGGIVQNEWQLYGPAPTFVTATSFTLAGDRTAIFHVGRRVKTTNTGAVLVYGTIASSAYTTETLVTVVNDSGTINIGLSSVSYGLLSAVSPSIESRTVPEGGTGRVTFAVNAPIFSGTTATGAFQTGTGGAGTAGQVLVSNGGSTAPSFQSFTSVATNTTNVYTKNQSVLPVALTPGTTVSVDASLSNCFTLTPAQNFTLANPTNLTNGMIINFRFKQDGTGSRIATWGSKYKFAGGVAGVLTTAAGGVDFMSCYYDLTSDTIDCVLNTGFA